MPARRRFGAACGAVLACAAGMAWGETRGQAGTLSLRAGDIAVASLPNLLTSGGAFTAGKHYVLVLSEQMTQSRAMALEAAGVQLEGYLPTQAYVTRLDGVQPAWLNGLGFVASVTEYQDAWRVDSTIGTREFKTEERRALAAEGKVALRVLLFAHVGLEGKVGAELAAIPGLTVHGTEQMRDSLSVVVTLPRSAVGKLATIADIQCAEELAEFTQRDTNQRWLVQSGTLNSTPLYAHGLTGTGQVVAVIDGPVMYGHCDFDDAAHAIGPDHRKILAYNVVPLPSVFDSHGTHVAGIAVGDPLVESPIRGVAYTAKMVYNNWPQATSASFLDKFTLHQSQGARVHTNSWGNDGTTQYDYACAALDAFMHDNEDSLVVFAVSNSPTVRNPENAKDTLAVSRGGNYPNQDQICLYLNQLPGAGPTADGRRKPEIVVPGCGIASAGTSGQCAGVFQTGTSMAAPGAGGAAALIRQYFTDGYYPTGAAVANHAMTPSGALLKAVVCNSGVDMAPAGYPSNLEGWGRLQADNALHFPGDADFLVVRDVRNNSADALHTDGIREVRINVVNASVILRITLAYSDQPATLPATVATVNDLDLIVISPSGDMFLGNNLVSGWSIPGGLPDPINTLEQVLVQTPQTGTWTVRVHGTAVNQGAQGFGLCIVGGITEATCAADFNQDGALDLFDYLDFVQAFSNGDAGADFNQDSTIDFFDYLDFLDAFAAGC